MKPTYFECACSSPDHMFFAVQFDDDSYLYLGVQLSKLPWWKRLVVAAKYIAGKSGNFPHWEETMLDYGKVKKLHTYLAGFLETKDPANEGLQPEGYKCLNNDL